MAPRSAFSSIGSFFEVMGSAAAVSRAVEAGRMPRIADLNKLGIDPETFRRIGR